MVHQQGIGVWKTFCDPQFFHTSMPCWLKTCVHCKFQCRKIADCSNASTQKCAIRSHLPPVWWQTHETTATFWGGFLCKLQVERAGVAYAGSNILRPWKIAMDSAWSITSHFGDTHDRPARRWFRRFFQALRAASTVVGKCPITTPLVWHTVVDVYCPLALCTKISVHCRPDLGRKMQARCTGHWFKLLRGTGEGSLHLWYSTSAPPGPVCALVWCKTVRWVISFQNSALIKNCSRGSLSSCIVHNNCNSLYTWFAWKNASQVHSSLLCAALLYWSQVLSTSVTPRADHLRYFSHWCNSPCAIGTCPVTTLILSRTALP